MCDMYFGNLQVLKVIELEGLGRNGAQTVPVQSQHLQGVGQVFKAVRLQRRDAVVVHVPERNRNMKLCLASPSGFLPKYFPTTVNYFCALMTENPFFPPSVAI